MIHKTLLPMRSRFARLSKHLRDTILETLHPRREVRTILTERDERMQMIRHQNIPPQVSPTLNTQGTKPLHSAPNRLVRQQPPPIRCASRHEINRMPLEDVIKPPQSMNHQTTLPQLTSSVQDQCNVLDLKHTHTQKVRRSQSAATPTPTAPAVYDRRTSPQTTVPAVYDRRTSPSPVPAVYDRRKISRRSTAGFSLTEVVVALGLIMATALPTLGVLSMGLGDAGVAATQYSIEALRGTVRAQLQNTTWPTPTHSNRWNHSVYFDSKGAPSQDGTQVSASVEARMTAAPGLGFDSPAIETVKIEFLAIPSGENLGNCFVQRVRHDLLASANASAP
jgi:uncharacterized protein (TIGR02598 family)